MLAEYVAQAEALSLVFQTDGAAVPTEESLSAVIRCAEQLHLWGESTGVLNLIESIESSFNKLPPVWILRIEFHRLRALSTMRRDQECLERTRTLLEEHQTARGTSGGEYDRIRILQGQALWHLNRTNEALDRIRQVRTELVGRAESGLHAYCSSVLASALLMSGAWDEAREFAIETWVLAKRTGATLYEGIGLAQLSIAERGRCRWSGSEDAAREAIRAYERIGARLQVVLVSRSLAVTLWKRGDLQSASRITSEIRELMGKTGHDIHVRYSWLLDALLQLHAGRPAAAVEALSQATRTESSVAQSRPELLRLEYLGDVELEQGNFEAALKRYDEVLPHALALIPRGDVVAELRRRRAECLAMTSRPQEAHDEAKEALAICLELGDRYEEAATYRTIALAAAVLGRHEEAKKHFDHGFAMYDDIETPYEWGKLWMSYGDWLSGSHAGAYESLDGAREAYRAACDHFEHMGAELKLMHARQRTTALEQRMRDEGVHEHAANEKPRPRRRPSLDRETQRRVQWAFDMFGVVTRYRPLLEMLEQVATVAVSDIPVLVLGESGTGKELIARGVHVISGRTGRLVEVNCSAVPATMMEAEFFGSVQGSYTGSTRDRAGLFEEAHEGSMFMDEIGEMPVDLQVKLLRFLETGEVRRIGATTGRNVDARLIAATNRDAVKMQAGEGFRQDLYYRLAHAVFTLPPLRSRGDDVVMLVDHFLDAFTAEARKRVTLSRAARERLTGFAWPGNVRQLRSLLQRVVVQTPDGVTVTPRDIPLAESAEAPRTFLEEMEGQEKHRIVEALEKTQYIKADAARILRMSRTTLLGKMKRHQIPG